MFLSYLPLGYRRLLVHRNRCDAWDWGMLMEAETSETKSTDLIFTYYIVDTYTWSITYLHLLTMTMKLKRKVLLCWDGGGDEDTVVLFSFACNLTWAPEHGNLNLQTHHAHRDFNTMLIDSLILIHLELMFPSASLFSARNRCQRIPPIHSNKTALGRVQCAVEYLCSLAPYQSGGFSTAGKQYKQLGF